MSDSRRDAASTITRPAGKPWPVPEAARFLGVCPRTIERAAKVGKVATIKMGGRTFLTDEEVKRIAVSGF